jgi:hypothetical protein
MKTTVATLLFLLFSIITRAQKAETITATADKNKKVMTVDASCGQCKLGLKGKSCDLAVKIDGKAYFVDGTHINAHGDAHANDGFCNAVRKAEVQGEVVNNRFAATYFKLVPESDTRTKAAELKKD